MRIEKIEITGNPPARKEECAVCTLPCIVVVKKGLDYDGMRLICPSCFEQGFTWKSTLKPEELKRYEVVDESPEDTIMKEKQ